MSLFKSLAGRINYIEMSGLNLREIGDSKQDLQTLWLRGGFPESYLAADDDVAMDWLENLIRTYLKRDTPQMGFRVPTARLRRLWTMWAHLQGETINYSKLAANSPELIRQKMPMMSIYRRQLIWITIWIIEEARPY